MARKKQIKDTDASPSTEKEEGLENIEGADLDTEDTAAEGSEPEEGAPADEAPADETPADEAPADEAPAESDPEEGEPDLDAAPEVAPPLVKSTPVQTGAVFAIKDGAVEFLLRRLRSRVSRADLPDAAQAEVILAAVAAGKTAVVYRNGVVLDSKTPGRPTFDVVNDLQRHGYLSAV